MMTGFNSMKDTFEGLIALEEYQLKTSKEMTSMRKASMLAEEMSKTVAALSAANTMLDLIDRNSDSDTGASREALAKECREALKDCMAGISQRKRKKTKTKAAINQTP